MMNIKLELLCIILVLAYHSANALICMKCEGPTNSACYKGVDSQTEFCQINQPVCFQETTRKPGEKIGSYKRGCAAADWCDKEKQKHKKDLKSCNVCKNDKCNRRG
ncbi:hypothetical protein HHI36_003029 [Cryptolaemus montrouzieri]|uniref:Uncharacterized protein n=1 Tax=Cryptolaemus montrouzieri TaxID=559131 RepID=A0ABD2PDR7_9CUCU